MNINQSDVSYYGNAQLSHLENFGLKGIEDIFVDALLQEHPIVIFENGHFMVIDAVIKIDGAVFGTTDDVYVYRCHNVDNNGTINWRGIDPRGLGAAYVINKKMTAIAARTTNTFFITGFCISSALFPLLIVFLH